MLPISGSMFLSNTDESTLTNYGWRIGREAPRPIVRFVRGNKMRNLDALYDEVSAAFQFPYYFGYNYAAFSECLGDLDWLEQSHSVVVIVTKFEEVLCDDLIEVPAFARSWQNAAKSFERSRIVLDGSSHPRFVTILNSQYGIDALTPAFRNVVGDPSFLGI